MPTRTWRMHHNHILNKDRPELDDVDWLSSGQIVEDALNGRSQALLLYVKLYTRAVAESRRVVDVGEVHGHTECFWKHVHVNATSTEVWMYTTCSCSTCKIKLQYMYETWAKTLLVHEQRRCSYMSKDVARRTLLKFSAHEINQLWNCLHKHGTRQCLRSRVQISMFGQYTA